MITVLLADDHPMVRDGLTRLLGRFDDVEVLEAVANGEEAVSAAANHEPRVVLMDLEMPALDGIEATRQILAAAPEIRIVVLTSFADRERILDALDAGACGYLLKDAEPEDLVRGIRAAARGEAPLAPRAAAEILNARSQRRHKGLFTGRERDVLRLVAEGLPNKLVANHLGISEKTVKGHLTRIYEGLGVTDRTQAALWAQRNRGY
jgi:DNA-binding NarL/FixJ family response regulator